MPGLTANTKIVLRDDASSQPTCNRPAMQVLVERRRQDKQQVGGALSEAWEAEDVCKAELGAANKRAEHNQWWADHGWQVGVGAVLGAEAVLTIIILIAKSLIPVR